MSKTMDHHALASQNHITKSWNGLEGTLTFFSFHPGPGMDRDILPWTRLLRAPPALHRTWDLTEPSPHPWHLLGTCIPSQDGPRYQSEAEGESQGLAAAQLCLSQRHPVGCPEMPSCHPLLCCRPVWSTQGLGGPEGGCSG